MQAWAAVFEAFVDDDSNGVIVAKQGSPTTFIRDAQDPIGELVDGAATGCEVSNITQSEVNTAVMNPRRGQ